MRAREITPDLSVRRRHDLAPVHIITRNFSVLRSEFEAIGGFDEGFTGYGWEDIELAMRLARAGRDVRLRPRAPSATTTTWRRSRGSARSCARPGTGAVYFWRKYDRSRRLGFFLEIFPAVLPMKWLVFRTPLFMPLFRWVLPRAERRGWLLLANECYTELIWEAYYEGVFEARRRSAAPQVAAPAPAPREPRAGDAAAPGVPTPVGGRRTPCTHGD